MSRLAFTSRLRGRRTIRSSRPQPAVGGNFGIAAAVMSIPIMAKSPLSSSQMSGTTVASRRFSRRWRADQGRCVLRTYLHCYYSSIQSQVFFAYFLRVTEDHLRQAMCSHVARLIA